MSDSFAVQQKLIQHCKATTLQQKFIKKKKHMVRFHLTFVRRATIKAKQKQTGAGMGKEKLESLYTAGGKIKWFNCFGKQFHSSSKG